MEFIKGITFGVLLMALGYWLTRRKWLEGEIERNDKFQPPSGRQVRWDIREDLHMLVLINYALLFLVLFLVFFKFW